MRVRETVIRPIANSTGVTIPNEMLEKYDLTICATLLQTLGGGYT